MKILENREVKNGILVPINLEFNGDNPVRVTPNYIDISFASKDTPAKILSNLFRYEFYYFGNKVQSIEAAIQSLKYEDKAIKEIIYQYFDLSSVHTKGMNPYAWQQDGILHTPVGPKNRFTEDYQYFLDQLYLSVFQNPFYRENLKGSSPKQLDHTIGEDDIKYTTLTRTEYISRLYALRYCAQNELLEEQETMNVLKKVREELK